MPTLLEIDIQNRFDLSDAELGVRSGNAPSAANGILPGQIEKSDGARILWPMHCIEQTPDVELPAGFATPESDDHFERLAFSFAASEMHEPRFVHGLVEY